jgi:hypothetical protein
MDKEESDNVKMRLPHIPDYITVERHGGWAAFRQAYLVATEKSIEEHNTIMQSFK